MENKKSLIALALVALVGIVGGTFAYFTSSTTLTNEFETGTYSTSVTEEFDNVPQYYLCYSDRTFVSYDDFTIYPLHKYKLVNIE